MEKVLDDDGDGHRDYATMMLILILMLTVFVCVVCLHASPKGDSVFLWWLI